MGERMREWLLRRLRRAPVVRPLWDEFERMVRERDAALAERDAALRLRDVLRPSAAAAPPAIEDCFRLSPEAAPRRAIIVPVQGAAARRAIELTLPFFAAYCRRISADLRVVRVPESVPPELVKPGLLPVARHYKRFAMIAADALIRDGCPDLFALVPEGRLGALVEGSRIDRRDLCAELAQLYGLPVRPPAERYIDAGVMVMGRAHLPLLEGMARGPVFRHPTGEGAYLNLALWRAGIAVHELPRDMNWVPAAAGEFDWRWAWIFRAAAAWRAPPTQAHGWRVGCHGDERVYTRVALEPLHCRYPVLAELAGQLRGEDLRVFHAADMQYNAPAARILVTGDDAAVMWCEATDDRRIMAFGPYAALPAGEWSVSLLGPDGATPAAPHIVIDACYAAGRMLLRQPAPVGPGASFAIRLAEDAADFEVRLYGDGRPWCVGAIVVRALGDGAGGERLPMTG